MFGHPGSSGGGHQRRGCGDVEGAAAISAGAAGIDDRVPFGFGQRKRGRAPPAWLWRSRRFRRPFRRARPMRPSNAASCSFSASPARMRRIRTAASSRVKRAALFDRTRAALDQIAIDSLRLPDRILAAQLKYRHAFAADNRASGLPRTSRSGYHTRVSAAEFRTASESGSAHENSRVSGKRNPARSMALPCPRARWRIPSKRPRVAQAAIRRGQCGCVVKAQIHAGGRGKGGGVKVARALDEAGTM